MMYRFFILLELSKRLIIIVDFRQANENGSMDGESETSEASLRVLVYTQEDRGHDPHCLETQVQNTF